MLKNHFIFLFLQFAIKISNKRCDKRLNSINELTKLVIEEKIPKIDTGQRDKDHDNRDRERDWNYQNNHHINNNHTQSNLINHTSHVSLNFFIFLFI